MSQGGKIDEIAVRTPYTREIMDRMSPTEVYWMSLVSAYNQALLHRDMSQQTASMARFNALIGAGLSVLVVTLSLGMPTGAEAAPLVCAALVAVTSVLSGLLAKAARKMEKSWEHVQSYDIMPIAYSLWDELTVRFREFSITVAGILTPIRTVPELPVKKPAT